MRTEINEVLTDSINYDFSLGCLERLQSHADMWRVKWELVVSRNFDDFWLICVDGDSSCGKRWESQRQGVFDRRIGLDIHTGERSDLYSTGRQQLSVVRIPVDVNVGDELAQSLLCLRLEGDLVRFLV